MSSPPIRFQRTYVTLAAADLRKTYVRDTIVVDDTGAGIGDVPLLLPKIGTAYAPVGLRITIVKPSDATHAVAITPAAPDEVSSGTPGAFPNFGVANNSALPSGQPGSVTLEATDMSLTATPQPNPTGGTPTTAGAWLALDSGAGGGSSGGVQSVTAGTGISNSGTAANPIINNTGVLSVTAGAGLVNSGTPTNEVLDVVAGNASIVANPNDIIVGYSGVVPTTASNAAAAVGIDVTPSHADHRHNVPTAAPLSIGAANVESVGGALTLARSDHQHQGVHSIAPGTGLSNSGTATDPVLNNTGVLSVTAGTNVTITGTAANPIVNAGIGQGTFTQLTGAGPFAMSSTPTDTIGVNPTGDAILNLPALAGVQDGRRVTIEHNGGSATSSVIILPNGADVIGNAAIFSRLFFGGSVQLQANVATGRWELLEYVSGMPTSPGYFVASTGSDAQPGTLTAPLATPQEAARRIGESGALIQSSITLVDTVNMGANPNLSFAPPTGNAIPTMVQGSSVVDLAGVVVTGGTIGTSSGTVAGATFITTANRTLNQDRGKILEVKTGPNAGTRYPIESNTAGPNTVYTVPARLALAPTAANTVDIRSRVGGLTWTGEFVLDIPGGGIFDTFEELPTGTNAKFTPVGTTLQESGMRLRTAASGFAYGPRCNLESCCATGVLTGLLPASRQLWNPTGVTPCGNVFDGSAAVGAFSQTSGIVANYNASFTMNYSLGFDFLTEFRTQILFFGLCIHDDCGYYATDGGRLQTQAMRVQNGRGVFGSVLAPVSVFLAQRNAELSVQTTFFAATVNAACHLVSTDGSVLSQFAGIGGTTTGVNKLALNVVNGGVARGVNANTATGTVPGADVAVDAGTAFPIADATIMGTIGAQNGTFQHSTSNLGASPITVNKFSGDAAVAIGATVLVINNALADVGDHCHLTPTSINPSVAKWSAVCTLNTITITTDVAPTVAIWTFNWELVKATV